MHYVSEETLHKLQARFERLINDKTVHVDPKILDLVIKINRIPGIVTCFSCSGHTEEEERARHDANEETKQEDMVRRVFKYNPNQQADVIFVATKKGQPFLDAISTWMMKINQFDYRVFKPKLSMLRLLMPIEFEDNSPYSAFKLEAQYNSKQQDASEAIEMLLGAYEEYERAMTTYHEVKEHRGEIDVSPGSGSNVSGISLLAHIQRTYNVESSLNLVYCQKNITDDTIHTVMAPFYLMEFIGYDDVRCIRIRDKEEDRLQVVGLYGKSISLIFNLKTSVITYHITSGTTKANDLLRLLEPGQIK